MKTLFLTILIPFALSSAQIPAKLAKERAVLNQIWNMRSINLSNPAPAFKFRNRAQLKKYVYKVAKHYGLRHKILMQIVAVESNYCKYRANYASMDFGCFQINKSTIKLHKWNFKTVTQNDMLNAHAAAIILRDFKKAFRKSEPDTFVCRYNTGYRNLPETCERYMQKLAAAK